MEIERTPLPGLLIVGRVGPRYDLVKAIVPGAGGPGWILNDLIRPVANEVLSDFASNHYLDPQGAPSPFFSVKEWHVDDYRSLCNARHPFLVMCIMTDQPCHCGTVFRLGSEIFYGDPHVIYAAPLAMEHRSPDCRTHRRLLLRYCGEARDVYLGEFFNGQRPSNRSRRSTMAEEGQYKRTDLFTLVNGAIPELFQRQLTEVVKNIDDLNTDAKTKRSITLEVIFAPEASRQAVEVTVKTKAKLAGGKELEGTIFIVRDGSADPFAVVNNVNQPDLFKS